MESSYRSDDSLLVEQIQEVLAERRSEARVVRGVARPIFARRAGRAAAGATGVVGGLAFLAGTALGTIQHKASWSADWSTNGSLVTALLGVWMSMVIAYVVGRVAGGAWLDRQALAIDANAGRPREVLARLERVDPRADVVRLLDRVHTASLGWPLAALALILPLTLHLVVWVLLKGDDHMQPFDGWIQMSVIWVGLAHLVCAACCYRFGRKLAAGGYALTARFAVAESVKTVVASALGACVPGIMLFGIPPVVTAITGAVSLPWIFWWITRRVLDERVALAPMAA